MNYWPFSTIKSSPLMSPAFAWELAQFYTRAPSEPAFYACLDVARNTAPISIPGLAVIETEGAPHRFIFTEYPTWEQWSKLERTGAVQSSDGSLALIMDAIH